MQNLHLVVIVLLVAALAPTITEFPTPTVNSNPQGITEPDGAWSTQWAANKVGRIKTAGSIAELSPPAASSQPLGIKTNGLDGAHWFTDFNGDSAQAHRPRVSQRSASRVHPENFYKTSSG